MQIVSSRLLLCIVDGGVCSLPGRKVQRGTGGRMRRVHSGVGGDGRLERFGSNVFRHQMYGMCCGAVLAKLGNGLHQLRCRLSD